MSTTQIVLLFAMAAIGALAIGSQYGFGGAIVWLYASCLAVLLFNNVVSAIEELGDD